MPTDAIILHGACASGKTTLAKALQHQLDETYLHFRSDDFANSLPTKDPNSPLWSPKGLGIQIVREFYQFCTHLVRERHKIIVDHMAIGSHYSELFIAPLQEEGFNIFSVRVFCPLNECERREVHSPNKEVGLSRKHYDEVYSVPCDLEVNNFENEPQDCALQIARLVEK